MRKTVVLALASALTVAVGAAGVAEAVQGQQTMAVKLQANKAGTAKKPRSVGKLSTDLAIVPAATDPPFATKTATLFFDKNLVFNGAKFPSCTPVQAKSGSAKCRTAKVGTGSSSADATTADPTAPGGKRSLGVESLTVTAFNGPGGRTLNLLVKGSTPLPINAVLVAKLQNASGAFGKKLVVAIPNDLQHPLAPAVFATLTSFKTTVGGTSRGTPYVGLKGCTGGKLQFKGVFVFTDGTTQSPTTTAACRK